MNTPPLASRTKPTRGWRYMRYFGLFLFCVLLLKLDWQLVYQTLGKADPFWIIVAGITNFLFIQFKSLRWFTLLRLQGIEYGFSRSMRVYQASSFFSLITPGRVGEIIKASFLKKDLGVPQPLGMVSVLMDRLLDLICLAGSALILILLVNTSPELVRACIAFSVLIGVGVLVLVSSRGVMSMVRLVSRLPFVGTVLRRSETDIISAQSALRKMFGPGLLFPLLISLVTYLTLYIGGYALARAQNLPLSLLDCAYCIALANIVSLLPISISGIGTRDFTVILLFADRGLGQEQALIFSFGYFLVNIFFGHGPGAVYWIQESGTSSDDRLYQPLLDKPNSR